MSLHVQHQLFPWSCFCDAGEGKFGKLPAVDQWRATILFEPGLKHQHIPDVILPASLTGKKLLPKPPNGTWVKEPFETQPIFSQQSLSPIAQGAAQPGVQRDAKSGLWSLHY